MRIFVETMDDHKSQYYCRLDKLSEFFFECILIRGSYWDILRIFDYLTIVSYCLPLVDRVRFPHFDGIDGVVANSVASLDISV